MLMTSRPVLTLLILGTVLLSGCKKDDETVTPVTPQNSLTLGTGINAASLTLTGVSTTFRISGGTVVIYWRLETVDDLAGSGISIAIDKVSGGSTTPFATFPYTNPQNYGHIVLSSFTMNLTGSYRASAYLTNSSTAAATVDFRVQ